MSFANKIFRKQRIQKNQKKTSIAVQVCTFKTLSCLHENYVTGLRIELATPRFAVRCVVFYACESGIFSCLRKFIHSVPRACHGTVYGKKISNDQELLQSDPTSCPQNQTGNN